MSIWASAATPETVGGTSKRPSVCWTRPCKPAAPECRPSSKRRLGVSRAGRRVYQDRSIDIDILFFGDKRILTPDLTVPHPLAAQRPFVMIPLREIARPGLKRAFPDLFREAGE